VRGCLEHRREPVFHSQQRPAGSGPPRRTKFVRAPSAERPQSGEPKRGGNPPILLDSIIRRGSTVKSE
jgi:hypothetical protein